MHVAGHRRILKATWPWLWIAALAFVEPALPVHADMPPASAGGSGAQLPAPAATRNEDSTPRDAVLPASPAIAGPRNLPAPDAAEVLRAKAHLLRLGYDAGSLDAAPDARFRAALYEFQRAQGLPPSGALDNVTARALGMQEE